MIESLGALCSFVNGGTPSRANPDYFTGDIPWITGADMVGPTVACGRSRITDLAIRESATNRVPARTVLLVTRTAVGKVAVTERDLCFSQDITGLIPDQKRLDTSYLVHFLRTKEDYFDRRSRGATIRGISRSVIADIQVPLPHLPEQRRIAAILDRADALRAKRRSAIAQLDTLAQSIFLDMFGSTDGRTWPRVDLRDAYWFQEGPGIRKWQFTSAGVKLLNVGNIEKDGTLNLEKTDRHISASEANGKYKHFLVEVGDLVIASSGISFDRDGLLRTRGAFISEQHLPLCMNTSTIRFKAVPSVSHLAYLRVWLNSYEFRSQITRLVTGSAQQNFGPSHLSSLTITLPRFATQSRFAGKVNDVDRLKDKYRASLCRLDTLFSSLQYRAFQGEL